MSPLISTILIGIRCHSGQSEVAQLRTTISLWHIKNGTGVISPASVIPRSNRWDERSIPPIQSSLLSVKSSQLRDWRDNYPGIFLDQDRVRYFQMHDLWHLVPHQGHLIPHHGFHCRRPFCSINKVDSVIVFVVEVGGLGPRYSEV